MLKLLLHHCRGPLLENRGSIEIGKYLKFHRARFNSSRRQKAVPPPPPSSPRPRASSSLAFVASAARCRGVHIENVHRECIICHVIARSVEPPLLQIGQVCICRMYSPAGKYSRSWNIRPINLHIILLSRVDNLTGFRQIAHNKISLAHELSLDTIQTNWMNLVRSKYNTSVH